MTGRKHISIGVVTTALFVGIPQYAQGGLDLSVLLPAVAAAAAGSLAPDLDHPNSLASLSIPSTLVVCAGVFLPARAYELGHPGPLSLGLSHLGPEWVWWAWTSIAAGMGLLITSYVLGAVFGHRGVVHSVAFGSGATALVLVGLALARAPLWLALPFGWGWFAHLMADALTPAGLSKMLWPIAKRS